MPKCGGCKCGRCAQLGSQYTFQEEKELQLIRSGLTYKAGDKGEPGRWFCRCPWVEDPATLPENKYIALATLSSIERSLNRNNFRQIYAEQIEDLKQREVCRKLSKEEDENWKGPKYYICHLAIRSKSMRTPVRICFNSSQLTQGTSLNDKLAKGPEAYMNSLVSVLLRWREFPGVILGDISKMFYSIGLETGVDQQTHRFLWRDSPEEEPTTYIMTALSMGDNFSPVAAMEALYQTGKRISDTDKEVAYVLQKSSYVDDLVHSTLENPLEVARRVDSILKKHGFKIEEWQLKGENTGRDAKTLYCDKPTVPPQTKLNSFPSRLMVNHSYLTELEVLQLVLLKIIYLHFCLPLLMWNLYILGSLLLLPCISCT